MLRRGRVLRWMYRGGRPNRTARLLNRLSAAQFERVAAQVPVFLVTRC